MYARRCEIAIASKTSGAFPRGADAAHDVCTVRVQVAKSRAGVGVVVEEACEGEEEDGDDDDDEDEGGGVVVEEEEMETDMELLARGSIAAREMTSTATRSPRDGCGVGIV